MHDDLIKRLRRCFNGLEGLQTDQGDYGVLAEAAAALAEAQATIARLEAEVARLREGLIGVKHSGSLAYAKMTATETLSPREGGA